MMKKVLIIITLSISILFGCSPKVDLESGIYGLLRTSQGMQIASIAKPDEKIATFTGMITTSITKDDSNKLWIPLEAEKASGKDDQVAVVASGKVVKTIENSYSRPIKVIDGPNEMIVVLYRETGYQGTVVFMNKHNYEIIKTIEIDGYLNNAASDKDYLYVASDNSEKNMGSYIYKISFSDFKVHQVELADSLRITTILIDNEYVYTAAAAINNKTKDDGKSYLFKLRTQDLGITEKYEVLKSPIALEKHNTYLYLLHMSYAESPMWGGKLTKFDIINKTTEEITLPFVADNMLLLENKLLFSASVSDGNRIPDKYIELNLLNNEIKELPGKKFFTNLVEYK